MARFNIDPASDILAFARGEAEPIMKWDPKERAFTDVQKTERDGEKRALWRLPVTVDINGDVATQAVEVASPTKPVVKRGTPVQLDGLGIEVNEYDGRTSLKWFAADVGSERHAMPKASAGGDSK